MSGYKSAFRKAIALVTAGLMSVTSIPAYAGETEGIAAMTEAQTQAETAVPETQAETKSPEITGSETSVPETAAAETPSQEAEKKTQETQSAGEAQQETQAQTEGTEENQTSVKKTDVKDFLVVLPVKDGVSYSNIDASHKSENDSTAEDIVLVYTAGQKVGFTVTTSYAYSVYNAQADTDILTSENVKDGKVSFTMPAADLIVRFTEKASDTQTETVSPETQAPETEPAKKTAESVSETETDAEPVQAEAQADEQPVTEAVKEEAQTEAGAETETTVAAKEEDTTKTEVPGEKLDGQDAVRAKYPEIGSTFTMEPIQTWYMDKKYDPETYVAENYGYYSDENVSCKLEGNGADLSVPGKYTLVYRFTLKDDGDGVYDDGSYYWFVSVPVTVVEVKANATNGSDNFASLMSDRQDASYTGIIPETIGETVDDGEMTVLKGSGITADALNPGYDLHWYGLSVEDDGGFDADKTGTYTVKYSVHDNIDPELRFYAIVKVNVVDSYDAVNDGKTTVRVAFKYFTADVEKADGSVETATYGKDVTADSVKSITVRSEMIDEAISPTFTVEKDGKAEETDGIVSAKAIDDGKEVKADLSIPDDGSTYLVSVDWPDYDGKNAPAKTSGGINMQEYLDENYDGISVDEYFGSDGGDDEETAGIYESALSSSLIRTARLAAPVLRAPAKEKTLKTFTGSYGKATGVSTAHNYNPPGVGYNAYSVTLTKKWRTKVLAEIEKLGAQEKSSSKLEGSFYLACVTGHVGAAPSNNGFAVKVTTKLIDTDGDNVPNKVTVSTTWSNGASGYQTFSGSKSFKLTKPNAPASVSIKKTSTNAATNYNPAYSLAGAVFVVRNNENSYTLVTNEYGDTDDIAVKPGTYTVTETQAPAGFKLNTAIPNVTVKAGQNVDIPVADEPYSMASIRKVSANPGITDGGGMSSVNSNMYSLAGAVFTLTNRANNGIVYTFTTDAAGNSAPQIVEPGTYGVTEVNPPKGFRKQESIPDIAIGAGESKTIDVADEPYFGTLNVLLKKVTNGYSTSKSMANAEFTVRYYDQTSANGSPKRTWVIKTIDGIVGGKHAFTTKLDAAHLVRGDALYGDNIVPLGTITVQETKAPEGFKLSDQVLTYHIDENHLTVGGTVENASEIIEEPNFGDIRIRKTDSEQGGTPQGNATLEGAVFEIISDNDFTVNRHDEGLKEYKKGDVVAEITTDKDGYAQTTGNLLQAGASYIVREKKTPEGYRLLTESRTVTLEDKYGTVADTTYDPKMFPEEVIRGGISIQKQDWYVTDNKPEGAASLKGAKFQVKNISAGSVIVNGVVYNSGDVITGLDLTTDANGYCESGLVLPYGTYEVSETKAPEGYRLNTSKVSVTIDKDGEVKAVESPEKTGSKTWREHTIMFDVKINKFRDHSQNEDSVSDTLTPLEGAKFEIISLNDRPVYVGGKTYGKNQVVATIVTDKNGVATTKTVKDDDELGTLPYGRYKVHESYAPEGLNKVADFEIDGTSSGQVYDGKYYDANFKNDRPIEAPVTIEKVDAESGKVIGTPGASFQILESDHKTPHVFKVLGSHIKSVDTFTITEDGTVILPQKLPYGTYFIHEVKAPDGYVLPDEDTKFTVDKLRQWTDSQTELLRDMPQKGRVVVKKTDKKTGAALAGAVFSVTAAEDIVTGDGTVHYKKGEEVTKFVTGQDGVGKSSLLYLGKYKVHEISAPQGFMLNASVFDVELKYHGQNVKTFDCDPISVTNLPTEFTPEKTDVDGVSMPGVSFKITRIGGPESKGAAFSGSIAGGEFTTGRDGKFTASYIVSGLYTLTETKTLPGFVLDRTPRYFIVDENGHIAECDSQGKAKGSLDRNLLETVWKNAYTNTEFYKTDVAKKLLAGAKLKVVDKDGNVVRYLGDDNVSYLTAEWTSASEVKKIRKFPVGDFTLVEESAPSGYVKASPVHFTVKETSDTQKYSMIDKQLFVTKTDVTGEKEIPGAKLVVKDTNGKTVDAWTSTGKPHAVSGLEAGKTYTLTETLAPREYVRASTITFRVEDDGKNQTVRMIDKQLLVDKTNVAGDKEVEGAKLSVSGKDGKVIDEWVSGKTPHKVSGLEVGETYVLTEKTAPEGFVRSESVEFTVEDDGKIQTVVMKDRQVFLNKVDITGEKEVPGAEITVTDKDGKLIDKWVSSDKPHAISGLEEGKSYVLTEKTAPEGFSRNPESIEFSIPSESGDQHLVMKDRQVFVTKTDLTGEQEIAGAHLRVEDGNGNTVDEWVSTKKPHPVSGIVDGEKYTLIETKPADGYVTAESIEFTVDTELTTNQTVGMKDDVTKLEISKTDLTNGKELPGAHLVIKDGNGNVVEEWDSTDKPHYVEKLPIGKYTLVETKPADGYVTAENVEFEIKDTPEIQTVEMKDDVTKLEISKTDLTNGKELPGAHLVIKDGNGNVVEEWDSTDKPHYVEKLPIGKYTLVETKPADGYVTAENVEFEIKDTPEIQTVEMKDDVTKLEISKTDLTNGKELPGAHLVIKDGNGNVVEEWDSTDKPHYVEKLPIGRYTLVETKPADGYVTAESIEFEVKDTPEIQTVEMKDDVTKVEISKQDITTKKELPGAKLEIRDEDGKTIEKWVSEKKPHYIEKLKVGKYTLVETTAPNGYEVSEAVRFEVDDTGEIQHVVMYDTPKSPNPKTGDPFAPGTLIPIAAAAAALIAGGVFVGRKKRKGGNAEDEKQDDNKHEDS